MFRWILQLASKRAEVFLLNQFTIQFAIDLIKTILCFNLNHSCLGEAEQMAAHFDYLCEAEFPGAQLAEHVAKQSIESTDLQNRKNAVIAAK